jgi:hypothetical protein
MTTVEITGDQLVVTMRGLDRWWSLRRRLTVPLAHVRGATADPGVGRESAGLRSPGTHVPRVLTAGSYRKDGEWTFWNLRAGQQPLVVQLSDERYARLVLGVADARATAERIEQFLSRR